MSASPANPVSEVSEHPPARTPFWRSIARVSRRKRNILVSFVIIAAVVTANWRYRITRPDYRFARGQAAIAKRDWKSSDVLATKLESTGYPDHAHLLRAEAFYARKEPELALQECNQIRDEGTIRLRAASLSGRCLLDMGVLAEANRVFSFVISEEQDNTDAHRGVATVAYDLVHVNRAIHPLEQVFRLDPADARPHRLLGEILRDSDDTLNAVNEFQEALRLGAGLSSTARAEIQFEIAEGQIQLRRFGEA